MFLNDHLPVTFWIMTLHLTHWKLSPHMVSRPLGSNLTTNTNYYWGSRSTWGCWPLRQHRRSGATTYFYWWDPPWEFQSGYSLQLRDSRAGGDLHSLAVSASSVSWDLISQKCTLFDTGHFPGFHIHRDTSPGALGPTRFHRSKGRRSGTRKGWRTENICQISGWRCRSWWRQLESKHSGQLPGAGLISRAIQSTDTSCKHTLAGICCTQTDKDKKRRFISDV